ncbi:MAG: hypothetical protein IPL49_17890 [Saprospirales bacterium]|nr:hypothetical protein [Saprospirales bacterium]
MPTISGGDTVNTASRMESNGEVDRVNISKCTYDLVHPYFECVPGYDGGEEQGTSGDVFCQ